MTKVKRLMVLIMVLFSITWCLIPSVAYASHEDYFTATMTQTGKYEILVNIVTKRNMTNVVITEKYYDENKNLLGSDVQRRASLEANQRYQFIFYLNEVMSDNDYKKFKSFNTQIDYDENGRISLDDADIHGGMPTISDTGSTTNNKSAFENFMLKNLGENYKTILIAGGAGLIVLIVLISAIKRKK